MRLLASEIAAILENNHHNRPRHNLVGIIAKFTCFDTMYMCAKFQAFTTKFTIFSNLLDDIEKQGKRWQYANQL